MPRVFEEEQLNIEWKNPDFESLQNYCESFIPMDQESLNILVDSLKSEFQRRKKKGLIINYFNQGEDKALGQIVSNRLVATVGRLRGMKPKKNEVKRTLNKRQLRTEDSGVRKEKKLMKIADVSK